MSVDDSTRTVRIYKVTVLCKDLNNEMPGGLTLDTSVSRLPFAKIMAFEERRIDWNDEHPLNNPKTEIAAFQSLFKDPEAVLSTRGEREFYDLMQAYRHTPITDQKAVAAAYEAVKAFVIKRY